MKKIINLSAILLIVLVFASCERINDVAQINETSQELQLKQSSQVLRIFSTTSVEKPKGSGNWVVISAKCDSENGNCLPDVVIVGSASGSLSRALKEGSKEVQQYFIENKEEWQKILCEKYKEDKLFASLLNGEVTANTVCFLDDTYYIGFYPVKSGIPEKSSEYLRILQYKEK